MEISAVHRLPRRADVAREQLRGVGLALRREATVAAGVLALASILIVWAQLRGEGALDLAPEMGIPIALLALLLPMAVWKGEGPASRSYHHAMPVEIGAHAVARGLAGLVWMLGAAGAYFGWMALVAAGTGGWVDSEPWFRWAGPVVGAVALYLLGTALALRAVHPWRWIGGAVVGHTFLRALAGPGGDMPLFRAADRVLSGRYGLYTLLSGSAPVHVHKWNDLYGEVNYATRVPNAGVWMVSAWLWIAIAITLFFWAAYRQPEA
ncbi:hypothetical protein [Longimicrobium sp.]|uniref:hypothetical protein n=1 Tax=Longimicrobium sp. TaxID=2029185 RepID=UPI002BEABCC4|nr:hypothetical protein [Longimicrobium sp.]HSU16517.1 hypothetical protein [Longimicrobium sp.]